MKIKKLALIGIGHIGASIALGSRKAGLVEHIAISTRRAETLTRAQELQLGDTYHSQAADAVIDADLVIVCVPVGVSGVVTASFAKALKKGAIVSDVGSVKQSVINQMAPLLPDYVHFVPGHPMAGTEFSGPDAGLEDLFKERWTILTPMEAVDSKAVALLQTFWENLGAKVEIMSAGHHDLVCAMTSHVPHLIAYNIVGTTSELEDTIRSEVIKFSASGFRDFTRIAASDPIMWRDVFLHNKEAVLDALGRFSDDLAQLQKAVRAGDGDFMFDLFTRTRAIRKGVIEAGQVESTAPQEGER